MTIARMLRRCGLAALLLVSAGCGRTPTTEPTEPRQEVEPVGIGDLHTAYVEDAAGAARRYGDRPTVKLYVDEVSVTSTGFMVTRSTGEGITHRVYFPKSAAAKLEGKKGEVIVARGKVTMSTPRGLVMHCD